MESDKKSWSTYMINRFLSMNPNWIEVVDSLQYVTQGMPPELVYLTYIGIIPKTHKFFKYIKGDKSSVFQDWIVELICKHYEVGSDQAKEYLEILYATDEGREDIRYVCELYGIDKKKVKSLKLDKK